jgi:four helix bundle protein
MCAECRSGWNEEFHVGSLRQNRRQSFISRLWDLNSHLRTAASGARSLQPVRGAKPPSTSERGWGPASFEKGATGACRRFCASVVTSTLRNLQQSPEELRFYAVNGDLEEAPTLRMPVGRVDHFSKLVCWQLARELQRVVFAIASRATFNRNLELRDQLRDAASSARRNIAEGFGRRTHRDIANFFNVSLTSINEVEDALDEAVDDGYVTSSDIAVAMNLCKRATVATSRFRNSVKDRPDPPWNRWPKTRSRTARRGLEAPRTRRTPRT